MRTEITFVLNGSPLTVDVRPQDRLVHVLRDRLGLTGTKIGCGEGECGACTVIVDGLAVNSCLFPALELPGRSVTTIEGLAGADHRLSDLQQAFVDAGAIQCGFCSPGMIMAAKALLDANPDPSPRQIRVALAGNLCRCTGYFQIVDAVRLAATRLREPSSRRGEVAP